LIYLVKKDIWLMVLMILIICKTSKKKVGHNQLTRNK
jgi:hypothetical protein